MWCKHALAAAQGVSENLLGAVLNKVDMNRFGRYTGEDTSYYYNKHYSRDMDIRSSGMLAGRSAARNVVLTRIFVAAVGCTAVIWGLVTLPIFWRQSTLERTAQWIIRRRVLQGRSLSGVVPL